MSVQYWDRNRICHVKKPRFRDGSFKVVWQCSIQYDGGFLKMTLTRSESTKSQGMNAKTKHSKVVLRRDLHSKEMGGKGKEERV